MFPHPTTTSSLTRRPRLERRTLVILGVLFTAYALLFFYPPNGTGFDNLFYYAYLTSPAFDGDLDLVNDYYLSNNNYGGGFLSHMTPKGVLSNWFAIGTPLLWLPFFLWTRGIIVLLSTFTELPAGWLDDRYAAPYLLSIGFATMAYGLLTTLFFYRICRFRYRRFPSALASVAAFFASPLVYYSLISTDMAHLPSAFAASLLVYVLYRERKFLSYSSYFMITAAFALTVLVRWQEVIYAPTIVAFWLTSMCRPRTRTRVHPIPAIALSALLFLLLFSPQMAYWWAIAGKLLYMPQGSGYMRWSQPQVVNLLFSGWNGLFTTHPLLLLGALGLLVYLVKSPGKLIPLGFLVTFALAVYVNACVSDWFGGASFGSRRFCSLMPIIVVGFASFFSLFKRWWKIVPMLMVVIAVFWNTLCMIFTSRGISPYNFGVEFWNLRRDLLDVLPALLLSLPWNSLAGLYQFFTNDQIYGQLIAAITVALVVVTIVVIRQSVTSRARTPAAAIITLAILSVLVVDGILILLSPAPRPDAIAYANASWRTSTMRPAQKKSELRRLIDKRYDNPALYTYATEQFPQAFPLHQTQREVFRISPHFWARYVSSFPPTPGLEKLRPIADGLHRLAFPAPIIIINTQISKHFATGTPEEFRAWQQMLHFNPFHIAALKRLVEIAREKKDEEARYKYKSRLTHVLDAKIASYFSIAEKTRDLSSYLYFTGFRSAFIERAELHAYNRNTKDILNLQNQLSRLGVNDEQFKAALTEKH